MFVTIHHGQWEVENVKFPISGRGMRAHFKAHKVREVLCSSSVDFPEESGAPFDRNRAYKILVKALSWR